VRKKLILLHTVFSLALAGVLAAAMWPSITKVVEEAELHEARLALSMVASAVTVARVEGLGRAGVPGLGRPAGGAGGGGGGGGGVDPDRIVEALGRQFGDGIRVARGTLDMAGHPSALGPLSDVRMTGLNGTGRLPSGAVAALYVDPTDGSGYIASVSLAGARKAVRRLYLFMTAALLGVYALIAVTLEVLVLPRHVYRPIQEILRADRAAQEGRREEEVIPARLIPADELGEIMSSRNATVLALRRHEQELAVALGQLGQAAADLRKKNLLLEAAQRNLADADRLASLGMMSAGLAHELNTPLAVIKGLVEQQTSRPDRRLDEGEAALLLRVVGRLERLSESLLDFARVRPPRTTPTPLRPLVEEAWTLVRLDRDAARATLVNRVEPGLVAPCDADRMLQVLVNLLRNAADALEDAAAGGAPPGEGTIVVEAAGVEREGQRWVSLTVTDSGPGLDPEILPRLFEPFASTRLDSHGTGLGLAVSEGIVREHGGVLSARNRGDGAGVSARGAVFEVLLPGEGIPQAGGVV
jgi:signal transduction histidine kinase